MTVTGSHILDNYATALLDGSAQHDGGGVDNRGTLTLSGCYLGNYADGSGGSLANFGTVTVTKCGWGGVASQGGAIANFGSAVVDTSSFFNASALTTFNDVTNGKGLGGAIYNAGTLSVSASTLTSNSAGSAGGGIWNAGILYIINASTVTGNTAPAGADLYNLGTLFISGDSTVGSIGP
jgi:hypothetical protein